MTVGTIGPELAAIVASRRADAADDALAVLADAYFLRSAGLWALGLALLHYRAGFGVADERPIPEELWGDDLARAIRGRTAARVETALPAWRQADRAHVVVPILDGDAVRGVLIATTEAPDVPADLLEHARALAPLLAFSEGSPRRIADEIERNVASALWAALLAVQDASDPAGRRAAAALGAALADIRALAARLRDGLPEVATLAEAAARYGEAYGLAVDDDGFPGEDRLPAADRAALTAIVREALANASTHGRARRARVQAGRTGDGALVLIVEDDGTGVTQEDLDRARARGGLGLIAIEGHASARGGTVALGRSELGGLRIEVSIPG